MDTYHCHRCGADIEKDDNRLRINIVVRVGPDDRETLEEFSLCESCARETEDHLVLETTSHEPM